MVSPESIRDSLLAACPEFAHRWNDPGNCFVDDDGAFSYSGLFAEFSHHIRDNYASISTGTLKVIANVVESGLSTQHPELHDAIATCFVENLEYEPFTDQLKSKLGPDTQALFVAERDAT